MVTGRSRGATDVGTGFAGAGVVVRLSGMSLLLTGATAEEGVLLLLLLVWFVVFGRSFRRFFGTGELNLFVTGHGLPAS